MSNIVYNNRPPTGTKLFGGDLSELTPRDDLVKIMECPVCQEIPVPPIYNCVKGHIICSKCRQLLSKCVLCKSIFTDSRNYVLESIVHTSKFLCDYHEHGCNEILTGSNLQTHQADCDYRPILCHLGRMDGCHNTLVNVPNYLKHLMEFHKISGIVGNDNDDTFLLKQTFTDSIKNKHNWLCTYKRFDGKIFLTRAFQIGSMFYWSLSLIGGDLEASKYSVNILIEKSKEDDVKVPRFMMTIPVNSVRKTKAEILDLPHAHMNEKVLKHFCQTVTNSDNKEKFQWRTQYTIIKVSPDKSSLAKN